MKRIEAGSYYSYLPEGCKLCRRGAKLVLFLTGVCKNSCFYCPISNERRDKDVLFANEREIKSTEDFLAEVELMSAEGVAITGGEPLLKLERVLEFVRLSQKLGLHVHLYTSIPAKEDVLKKLKVDEIRFHPPELKTPELYEEPIRIAKKLGIDAGFEIPTIRYEPKIVEIVNENDAFLNINQLEASETNWSALEERDFEITDYYVECREVVKMFEKAKKFHYCSARFKDKAQFRRRLIRMAMNHPDFYLVTRDGTLLCCRVEGELKRAERILRDSGFDFSVFEDCIETSIEVAENEKLKEALISEGFKLYLVERYPTAKRTLIEVSRV
ncbi:MAG: radical SAM protein [Archaeoglobaceae archaeon]|nr:radical SAM protein [Archaeoglobaceae archaeon]MDW8118037.1 radical SAM protein [Archaeoglobaceae archaeon]